MFNLWGVPWYPDILHFARFSLLALGYHCYLISTEWNKPLGCQRMTWQFGIRKYTMKLGKVDVSRFHDLNPKAPSVIWLNLLKKYVSEWWMVTIVLPFSVEPEWLKNCVLTCNVYSVLATGAFIPFPARLNPLCLPYAFIVPIATSNNMRKAASNGAVLSFYAEHR